MEDFYKQIIEIYNSLIDKLSDKVNLLINENKKLKEKLKQYEAIK